MYARLRMLNQGMSNILVCMPRMRPKCTVQVLGNPLDATLVELFYLVGFLHIFERFVDFVGPDVGACFEALDVTPFGDSSFDSGLVVF